MPRIIFVEAIPCSGKSTASHWLYVQMARQGLQVHWHYEEESEQDHPLHVYHADTSAELAWRFLARFDQFTRQQAAVNEIHIFEGTLFATFMGAMFTRDDLPESEMIQSFRRVIDRIRPLSPLLIYLRHPNPAGFLPLVAQHRGLTWHDWFIRWSCGRPYAKNRNLLGTDGAERYWKDMQNFYDRLYEQIDAAKLTLTVSPVNWESNRLEILDYLQLPCHPDPPLSTAQKESLAGQWQDQTGQWKPRHGAPRLATMLDPRGELFIEGLWWRRARLIPKQDDAFLVEGLCLELHFEKDGSGIAQRFRVVGKPIGSILGRTFIRQPNNIPAG